MNLLREFILIPNSGTLLFIVNKSGYNNLAIKVARRQDKFIQECVERVLPADTVYRLTELLITRYLPLTRQDLTQWHRHPASWLAEDDLDAPEYQLRACAERLLQNLCSRYCPIEAETSSSINLSAYLVHTVMPAVQINLNESQPLTAIDKVCVMDAAYNLIGLAADRLVDYLDFDKWLLEYLLPLCNPTQTPPSIKNQPIISAIINRRVCLLIGSWVNTTRCSPHTRPRIYEYFRHLYASTNNNYTFIVQCTAALQLRYVVDDWQFDPAQFQPYQRDLINGLLGLLKQNNRRDKELPLELMSRLVCVLSVVVERMAQWLSGDAPAIFSTMQQLWLSLFHGDSADDADEANYFTLQSALITCFAQLLPALLMSLPFISNSSGVENNNSKVQFLLAIIQYSLQPQSSQLGFLGEDAMEMWRCLVKYARSSEPVSLQIVQLSAPILLNCLSMVGGGVEDLLQPTLKLCTSLFLLNPSVFISSNCAAVLLNVLGDILLQSPHSASYSDDDSLLWALAEFVDFLAPQLPVGQFPMTFCSSLLQLLTAQTTVCSFYFNVYC
jgi:hypothetical protein